MKRYVLAYSGGLDTSVILKWLQVEHGAEVITLTADLGQSRELEGISRRARSAGAVACYVDDLRHEFVQDYVWPSLKAGALYQGSYPLATALGRPLIARRLVAIARQESADAVVHGCTGKGNDQVRLELGVGCLAPDLECLAPLRQWNLQSREDEMAWARQHGVPVAATSASPYSLDENLWGMAIECGALEDPWAAPPSDCWQITVAPEDGPAAATEIVVGFAEGIPISLDGEELNDVQLVQRLNALAGAHGVGRLDIVEDRLVGIKSRELYEAPAAICLHTAREALEQITLDRETRRMKTALGQEFARLVYDGLWFTPARAALSAFFDRACKPMTGEVRLELFKGHVQVTGRKAPASLYDESMATYGAGDRFQHNAADGFIQLFGLGARQAAQAEACADVADAATLTTERVVRA